MDDRNHRVHSADAVAKMSASERAHMHPIPDGVAKMNRKQRRDWARKNGWPKNITLDPALPEVEKARLLEERMKAMEEQVNG